MGHTTHRHAEVSCESFDTIGFSHPPSVGDHEERHWSAGHGRLESLPVCEARQGDVQTHFGNLPSAPDSSDITFLVPGRTCSPCLSTPS
jgi:hypothetical protein